MQEKTDERVTNNYQDVIIAWEERATTWNYEEKYVALGLEGYTSEAKLPIVFYGKKYWINRCDGTIREAWGDERKVTFATAISIYSLFFHSVQHPYTKGVWIPFREVKRAGGFAAAFIKTILEPFAKAFDGKKEKLLEAGEGLGFVKINDSEVGFEAKAFSCIPIRFLFWDGDDEFPAQTNILFDAEITQYVHEETVVLLASEGVQRLMDYDSSIT